MHFAQQFSNWIFIAFIGGIPLYAFLKKINVFDAFTTGANQGFETSISIVPFFIAMIVAVGMLRASGFFELLYSLLSHVLDLKNPLIFKCSIKDQSNRVSSPKVH